MSPGQLASGQSIDTETIRRLDRVAALSWPSEVIEGVAGWTCRRSTKTTSRRANSVLAATGKALETDITARLGEVEAWYERLGGRSRFQISPAMVPGNLDAVLEARGYRQEALTVVMAASAAVLANKSSKNVHVSADPGSAWLRCFEQANPMPGEAAARAATVDLARARGCETFYASGLSDADRTVAIGAAIAVRLDDVVYPFIHNMSTLLRFRRRVSVAPKGFGRAILNGLAQSVLAIGAEAVYLLVEDDNHAARRLYEQQGFEALYHYHYRTLVPAPKVG